MSCLTQTGSLPTHSGPVTSAPPDASMAASEAEGDSATTMDARDATSSVSPVDGSDIRDAGSDAEAPERDARVADVNAQETVVDAGKDGGPEDAAVDAGHDAAADAAVDAGDAASPSVPMHPCVSGKTYGDPLPPPGQRSARWLVGGFTFTEGPVWHAQQRQLFFTDMGYEDAGPDGLPSRIMRLDPPNAVSVFEPRSFTNGLALALDGRLLAATHDTQTLSWFDARTAARQTREIRYMGHHFNSPNDLTVHDNGTVYFTDPTWQLGPRTQELGFTGVYRVATDDSVTLIDDSLDMPNGIALSPDQRTLYVGSRDPEIIAYPLDEAGIPGEGQVFAEPGLSDGLAMDCAGNLYVSAGDIVVYNPSGQELGRITVDEEPANVAFGGADGRTLFITAETSLYKIELNTPGYPY